MRMRQKIIIFILSFICDIFKQGCCIFRPAFGCCALQTLVEIVIFSFFSAKKLKKAINFQQIFAKNMFFKFAPERWSTVLFPKNTTQGCKTSYLLFHYLCIIIFQKYPKKWKRRFWPAFGYNSIQKLVKIYNNC